MVEIVNIYSAALLYGALVTIILSISVIVGGTALGIVMALVARKFPWSKLIFLPLIHILMALPVLVILVWLFYALPLLNSRAALSPTITAFISLSLSLSAFIADIVLSGLNRLPRGQIEVATVLFNSRSLSTRYILAPLALRLMGIPVLGQYVTTLKFTTLASVVGVAEILHVAGDIIQSTYRPVQVYTIIAIIFVALIVPANLGLRIAERKLFPERSE